MKQEERIVATFNDMEEARTAQVKLQLHGMRARIADETKLQRFIFLSKPLAYAKILVKAEDFETARHLLQTEDMREQLLRNEVRCFKCGSSNVLYPHFTRNCLMPTFFEVLFSALHITQKKFYCRNCNHVWPVAERLRPGTDVLNWPSHHHGVAKEERG